MKMVLKSTEGYLDKRFVEHLLKYFQVLVFSQKDNIRKLKKLQPYFNEKIFTGKRKYNIKQCVIIVLKSIKYNTDSKESVIQIDNAAIFPFYNFKVRDIADLIDYGNLEIKGTHIFHDLYEYVQSHLHQLREQYEMGVF